MTILSAVDPDERLLLEDVELETLPVLLAVNVVEGRVINELAWEARQMVV